MQGHVHHGVKAGLDEGRPSGVVADLGGARHAGGMTGRTDGGKDLFARLEDLGGVGVDQIETGDWGNAFGDGFVGQGVRAGAYLGA